MTHGAFDERDSMTAHYKDLREAYARRMECHGNGMALMQPISGRDCLPVCAGFFDRNGDWNLVTPLYTADSAAQGGDSQSSQSTTSTATWSSQSSTNSYSSSSPYIPLPRPPQRVSSIDIVWQPKTSLGVRAYNLDASGGTPAILPAGIGADAHIKYSSSNKFGAILMTQRPVKLNAYNDEALFLQWLELNKAELYARYGAELKRYGMWIVTRTYTAPACSINAWMDNDKDAVVSLKAKAAMLGELGEDMDWKESVADKDWVHYKANGPEGVVVFLDGIEIRPFDWWLEGLRQGIGASSPSPPRVTVSRSRSAGRAPERRQQQQQQDGKNQRLRQGQGGDDDDDDDEEKSRGRHGRPTAATSSSSSTRPYAYQQDQHRLALPSSASATLRPDDQELPVRGRASSAGHSREKGKVLNSAPYAAVGESDARKLSNDSSTSTTTLSDSQAILPPSSHNSSSRPKEDPHLSHSTPTPNQSGHYSSISTSTSTSINTNGGNYHVQHHDGLRHGSAPLLSPPPLPSPSSNQHHVHHASSKPPNEEADEDADADADWYLTDSTVLQDSGLASGLSRSLSARRVSNPSSSSSSNKPQQRNQHGSSLGGSESGLRRSVSARRAGGGGDGREEGRRAERVGGRDERDGGGRAVQPIPTIAQEQHYYQQEREQEPQTQYERDSNSLSPTITMTSSERRDRSSSSSPPVKLSEDYRNNNTSTLKPSSSSSSSASSSTKPMPMPRSRSLRRESRSVAESGSKGERE